MPIWRAQVQFVTASIGDAGSDDDVKIELNAANRTWLESGWDDFEPGTRTYDLRMEGVSRLSDIDFFRIEKTGSDGWAIRHMYLIINGVPIYYEEFQPGLWLDNENGNSRVYFIDDFFMRPRSDWANYTVPVRPNIVPLDDIRFRIESLAGDKAITHNSLLMHRTGDFSVELFTLNANTWRVDLDFEEDKQWPAPNVNIDADFDLTSACSGGQPSFVVTNINVDDEWPLGYASDAVKTFLNDELGPRLNEMMKNFSYFPCPSIVVAPNGDLHFNPMHVLPDGGILVFDDNPSPLGLHVITGGEFRPFASTPFTATVKSKLRREAELDLIFELPAGTVLSNPVISVRDRDGTRTVTARVVRQDDGTSLVTLQDSVSARDDTEYTLGLRFPPSEGRTEQIGISIAPAARVDEEITPLRSETSFRYNSGLVNPKGTIIYRERR